MKKGLLASTALAAATAITAGTAAAAEAPTWKLTGNANFQFYWVDQDATGIKHVFNFSNNYPGASDDYASGVTISGSPGVAVFGAGTADSQDHDWYFGVDEAELQLNVSGTADNGLNYGFKIEINANTTDGTVADEARLQFSGGWGTLQMGDEDGAEDIMNYGGENLMGGTGGFDGDQDDYLYRAGSGVTWLAHYNGAIYSQSYFSVYSNTANLAAPAYPTIAGDTSDQTKISYFSPRFSGFQVGASLTPTPNNGDSFKADGSWENHIGLGANYDSSFGGLRLRASAVYSMAANADDLYEDISAWSVGGIVGFGPFSVGANYTDNGDSGVNVWWDDVNGVFASIPIETSYWNVAAAFESGPMSFSAGYFVSTKEVNVGAFEDSSYEHIALTADYTVAPGLGVYAEVNLISDQILSEPHYFFGDPPAIAQATSSNDTTSFVVGANVSF